MLKKGFTLVELIVIVAIIGIMTSFAIASYGGLKGKKSVEAETRKVVAAIREAQNFALTGYKAAPGCSHYSFGVNIGGDNKLYRISFDAPCAANDISYRLASGVVFTTSNDYAFSFGTPFAKPDFTSGFRQISLRMEATTNYICVYPSGRVVENGAAPCSS